MGLTNAEALESASRAIHLKFQEVFENDSAGAYKRFVELADTDSMENRSDFLGSGDVRKEQVGEKQFGSTREYNQSHTLAQHYAGLELKESQVKFDSLGLIARRIRSFGQRLEYWYDKAAFDLLITNPTGYDGVSFFSASHPHGPDGGTQSNTTTSAFSVTTLDGAIEAMMSLQMENGEPMEIMGNSLIVGPYNRKKALEITGSNRPVAVDSSGNFDATSSVVGATAIPSIYTGGMMDVVVWPRLVGSYKKYAYVHAAGHAAKPVVVYEGQTPKLSAITDENGVMRVMQGKYVWVVESWDAPAPGAWQTMYGILEP